MPSSTPTSPKKGATRTASSTTNAKTRAKSASAQGTKTSTRARKQASVEARKPSRARSWFAGVTVVIAALLLPTAMVGNWATAQIVNTQRFVDTLAPLASNPQVQKAITDTLTTEIDKAINLDAATQQVMDGIATALNLPPEVKKLVDGLSGPAASGVRGLVRETISKIVASPEFQKVFTESLRFTHQQVIALLSNDPKAVVVLDKDGTLALPLGPLVAQVKQQLVDDKVPFADLIPAVDVSVPIAKVPELVTARIAYQIGTGVGTWLPWIVLALFALSVLVAIRHWRQVMVAGIVTLVLAGLVAVGLSFGRVILISSISPTLAGASDVVYNSMVSYVSEMTGGLIAASVVAIIVGALFGLESTARLRTWFASGFAWARTSLDGVGVRTGSFGSALSKYRVAIRTLIIAIFGAILVFSTPVSAALTLWSTLLVAGLLVALEVLSRPDPAK